MFDSTYQFDLTDDAAQPREDINCGTVNRNPCSLGFWALVAEDYRTHGSDPLAQGFWTLFWHRFGNWRMSVRSRALRLPLSALYKLMAKACQWFCGMDLPYTVVVGRRVKLEHFGAMILVARRIGDDVILRQNTTIGIARKDITEGRPTIGDRVDVGTGAVLIGDITIGADTVIGANTLVNKDLPAGVVAVGAPARILSPKVTDKK